MGGLPERLPLPLLEGTMLEELDGLSHSRQVLGQVYRWAKPKEAGAECGDPVTLPQGK